MLLLLYNSVTNNDQITLTCTAILSVLKEQLATRTVLESKCSLPAVT